MRNSPSRALLKSRAVRIPLDEDFVSRGRSVEIVAFFRGFRPILNCALGATLDFGKRLDRLAVSFEGTAGIAALFLGQGVVVLGLGVPSGWGTSSLPGAV